MYKILLTCPPMINRIDNIKNLFIQNDLDLYISPNLWILIIRSNNFQYCSSL